MRENEIWNFFLLTGNIDSYLTYRKIKDLNDTEFAKEEESLNGESQGNSNKNS